MFRKWNVITQRKMHKSFMSDPSASNNHSDRILNLMQNFTSFGCIGNIILAQRRIPWEHSGLCSISRNRYFYTSYIDTHTHLRPFTGCSILECLTQRQCSIDSLHLMRTVAACGHADQLNLTLQLAWILAILIIPTYSIDYLLRVNRTKFEFVFTYQLVKSYSIFMCRYICHFQ